MSAIDLSQSAQIAGNEAEYGLRYAGLNFLDTNAQAVAQAERAELLTALAGSPRGFRGSKLDVKRLSPGCALCAEGSWSCLFINNRCNARCFYCPTAQEHFDLPATNNLEFRHPDDYVAYLEHFNFHGVSFSGGEPLLTPGRTLAFLRAVKKRFGAGIHTWLYTNGILVDDKILRQLRDAGLDEIRFDIGAVDYRLDRARLAVGLIPTVTVEIPAVPEEYERLRGLTSEMAESGIAHLNLHQLRLTPYNYPELNERGYTFLHGEKVTVLESELTALRLLLHVQERQIALPINYCSFVYKNRFQKGAGRRRAATTVLLPQEGVSEPGYLRSLALTGTHAALVAQSERFAAAGCDPAAWCHDQAVGELRFAPELCPLVELAGLSLRVGYALASLNARPVGRKTVLLLPLSQRMTLAAEREPISRQEFTGDAAALFFRLFLAGGEPALPSGWGEVELLERITEGFADYF